jgi:hypothetical protein
LLINDPCRNKIKSIHPFRVSLANDEPRDSTHTAYLDIPELNELYSVAHFFPDMANKSLLSVVQLCNEGYYVTFKIHVFPIFNSTDKAILKGQHDLGMGFLCINLRSDKHYTQIPEANNVYELRNTGSLFNYLHKAMFIPTKSALIQAVKIEDLTTWPDLTEDTINKHLKITPATAMGYMNKKRQHIL